MHSFIPAVRYVYVFIIGGIWSAENWRRSGKNTPLYGHG